MTIKEALQKLDPKNDEHWTQDGMPKLDVLSEIAGVKVTRKEATEAAPEFVRPSDEDENSDPPVEGTKPPEESDDSDDDSDDEEPEYAEAEDEDELDTVTAATEEALLAMTDADKAAAEAKEKAEAANRKYLRLNEKKRKLTPINSNQSEIQRYLATQKAVSQQKAQKQQQVLQHIKQSDITPKSKLDQAMSRKTGRGAQRPNFTQQ